MKRLCRKVIQLLLPIFALSLLALPSKATSVVMLSDDEMVVTSRFILTGEVRTVTSAWNDEHTMIWTYVEIKRDRLLKGKLGAKTIVLKQPGGTVGQSGIRVLGQPEFSPGQQVLLYLNTSPEGYIHVAHTFMGMFSIVEDKATGKKIVTRPTGSSEVQILSRNDEQPVTDRAPLKEYLNKIEKTLKDKAARIREVEAQQSLYPLITEPDEYYVTKRGPAEIFPNFAFMGDGVRWMEPDSGQPVVYYLNPDRAPVSGGGAAEIARAMAAWADQSGANIRLVVNGQTSNCGNVSDGVNTISFGDCLNQLDPPSGCAGVVAQTQVAWTFESKTVGGRTFQRLVETDLVFNKGMDCFLGISSNLAEVACHELGHSIGLAHSSDNAAIMRAYAHGGGRDATLGADDIAGVLAIYPASSGSGGGGTGGGGTGGGGTGGGGTGGGGGGGGTVTITSNTLPDGVVGQFYNAQLTASGGTPPYRWRVIGGILPPGLHVSSNGVVDGYPTTTGQYSVSVDVYDSTGQSANSAAKRLTLNVVSGGSNSQPTPFITRVKIKNSKKLFVFGEHFNDTSLILLNGVTLIPKSFNSEIGRLKYKGSLTLRADGANSVIVINNGKQSAPFFF